MFIKISLLVVFFAVMLGVVLMLTGKRRSTKEISNIIIGFGLLFIGISSMSSAVSPLRENEAFCNIFVTLGGNPFLGILTGALVTAIIQSSSASVGILQSLAAAGLVPFSAAIYIIMGQNIGTCVTAMMSSMGAKRNAKTAALMHLLFNVIGTAIFSVVAIIFFEVVNAGTDFGLITQTQISTVHTAFNVATTVLLFPASNLIIKLEKQSRNATVTYLWEKGTDSNEIDELVEDASTTSNQYTVTTPGWYQVTATASLNRESKFAESVVCKVTDMPKIPVTSYGTNSASKIDEELNAPLLTDSEAILDLKVNSVIPARYMGYSEELFTEGLTYTWVTKIADSTDPARPLGPEDVGVLVIDGLGTPTLTIKSPEGRTTHMFKCLISNTLNGKTVTQLESDEDVLPFYVI